MESGCHFDRPSDQRENGLGGHFDRLSDRWGKFSDRTKETGPETGWLVTEPVGVTLLAMDGATQVRRTGLVASSIVGSIPIFLDI